MREKYPYTYYATCFLLINVALAIMKTLLYHPAIKHQQAVIIMFLILGLGQAALVWNRVWWIKWFILFFSVSGTISYIVKHSWNHETLITAIFTVIGYLINIAVLVLLFKEPKEALGV